MCYVSQNGNLQNSCTYIMMQKVSERIYNIYCILENVLYSKIQYNIFIVKLIFKLFFYKFMILELTVCMWFTLYFIFFTFNFAFVFICLF